MNSTALTRQDLLSLEQYSSVRKEFRAKVIEHKRTRSVAIGPNATWTFEDRLTMQYQVQEMLRAERIFEEAGILEELASYNPLIPDGRNWKATMMLEYPDADERRVRLHALIGIEDRVWVRIAGDAPVYAVADEDMNRENEEKTSSVHFLRFELAPAMIAALKAGAELAIGVDHPSYDARIDPVSADTRAALTADLD